MKNIHKLISEILTKIIIFSVTRIGLEDLKSCASELKKEVYFDELNDLSNSGNYELIIFDSDIIDEESDYSYDNIERA